MFHILSFNSQLTNSQNLIEPLQYLWYFVVVTTSEPILRKIDCDLYVTLNMKNTYLAGHKSRQMKLSDLEFLQQPALEY